MILSGLELFPVVFVSNNCNMRIRDLILLLLATLFIVSCNGGEIIYNNSFSVIDYMPAPGQYINDTKTAGFNGEGTRQEAIEYAARRLAEGSWISLGAFGGYVVVGFDFPIESDGDYNISITGNAVEGSSEPGMVWVMEDANGNNEPDETWYRLKGSDDTKETTIINYSVSYYRPEQPFSPVLWSDNRGNNGYIDYLRAYHDQDCYYPAWIDSDSYTLTGVCVATNNFEDAYGNWINESLEWGYADNFSDIDRLSEVPGKCVNLFRIADAVDNEGNYVQLDEISFVKIQTGVNGKSGWLGEISTEISDVNDYNMIK